MKKCRNYPVKKLHLGHSRPRQDNLLSSLTAALLAAVLSLTSMPAAALLDCTVSATEVDFGVYDPTNSSSTDATGNVHVFCLGLLDILVQTNISLSIGGGSSYTLREMSSGADRISYNLYKEASHTTIWGDGTGGTGTFIDIILVVLLGVFIDHPINGSIPAGQYVAAGSYTDTITVTVEYHIL